MKTPNNKISSSDFDFGPVVMNHGMDWHLRTFLECKESYTQELHTLRDMENTAQPKPMIVKSFIKDYYQDNSPKHEVELWTQISDYVQKHESPTWVFSEVSVDEVDVNKDPYDDYELMTPRYNIWATVYTKDDITTTQPFIRQYRVVEKALEDLNFAKQSLYRELKTRFNQEVI